MKYSKIFGKTTHDFLSQSKFMSHQLLIKAGFIEESASGRYFFLPLGWRVHEKIKNIIKEEMDFTGAQEMISPTLHPLDLWQETNRTNTTGFELMKVSDRRGADFALGGTAEEMFVDVVRKKKLTHKDLPLTIYQFSNKFRDELRARGGLLRVREFVMKDAYSFHVDESDFLIEYDKMAKTYSKIFERLGLKTSMVEADNGYIGGEYCHEFQVEHELGEGKFFMTEDLNYCAHEDVAKFSLSSVNPDEPEKPFQIVAQPEWVKTMKDAEKHYQKEMQFFLKNVVYVNREGDVIIATIRGDLEVNKTKLEQALDLVGQLSEATEQDLAEIGTKTGYVHSWGHDFLKPKKAKTQNRNCKVVYVADNSLKTVKNFIGGQKSDTTDSINVNYGRDFAHNIEADIATAQAGFLSVDGKLKLIEKKGIEVGNIFQLGYHYSQKMKNATFVATDGTNKPYYMGCYGIGIGRTLATVVEKHHDHKGIVWPISIAPYHAHLVSLKGGEKQAEKIYQELLNRQVQVLWDDRDESAGVKFADADLIGLPIRLVISQKTNELIEYKERTSSETEMLNLDQLLEKISAKTSIIIKSYNK
jgi:prolyl-tRNA synthetase